MHKIGPKIRMHNHADRIILSVASFVVALYSHKSTLPASIGRALATFHMHDTYPYARVDPRVIIMSTCLRYECQSWALYKTILVCCCFMFSVFYQ